MKERIIEFWVGVFVVGGIASLLMLALQVSGLKNIYTQDSSYTITASFTHIGGLKARAKVAVAGVTIGRVNKVILETSEYGEYLATVELAISKKVKLPIDSAAKILTSGLLGDNYVGITPGQDEEYIQNGGTIEFTSQALLLEDLVSKFAVGGTKE